MPDKDNLSPKEDKESYKSLEKAEIESIEGLPKPLREIVLLFRQTISKSTAHPLIEKFKDDHIHKALDNLNTANEHQYELKKIDKRNRLIYSLIGAGIFIFLALYLLPKDKDVFFELLKTLTTIAGGIGIGGGYAVYKFYIGKK